jgi:hypothetical protein
LKPLTLSGTLKKPKFCDLHPTMSALSPTAFSIPSRPPMPCAGRLDAVLRISACERAGENNEAKGPVRALLNVIRLKGLEAIL